jgi:hypothetical protein
MEKSVQVYQHNYLTKDLFNVLKKDNQISMSTNIVAQKLANGFELETAIKLKRGFTNAQNSSYRKLKGKAEDLIKLINLEIE